MKTLRFMRLLVLALALIGVATLSGLSASPASALSGSDFRASRIMDDNVFFNGNTLNADQIQTFLNSKVPHCDTNGSQNSTHSNGSRLYTRAEWGTLKGYAPPYTCLKDYTQSVPGVAADNYCSSISSGDRTAAQIIQDVSRACNVSPMVMIVLLQKEQSLVTDDWPWSVQYRSATGYGCPDTAACDTTFYGFFNQVYYGARQFQRYAKLPGNYNHRGNATSFVQYKPNSSCGGTNIHMENQATAGLYNYTPYQPNAAALANLYGTGDGCSAYGNRNFWRLYNDWFGSTLGDSIAAQFHSQSNFPTLIAGESASAYLMYKNTGITPWYDSSSAPNNIGMANLATSQPLNRHSIFSATWQSPSRPAIHFAAVYESNGTTLASNQHVAQPGQIVKYAFDFTAPVGATAGTHREWFQPVLDGSPGWSMGGWAWLEVTVLPTTFQASLVSNPASVTLTPGQTQTIVLRYKNTGTGTIKDSTGAPSAGPFANLATAGQMNRRSLFDYNWISQGTRPAINFAAVYEADGTTLASNQHIARPGQIFTYEVRLAAHPGVTGGTHNEKFQPVLDGAQNWDIGGQANVSVTLNNANYQMQYHSQSSYPSIKAGNSGVGYFMFKNAGSGPLYDSTSIMGGWGMANLATAKDINRSSSFGQSWISRTRPAINFTAVYEADGTTLASNQHVAQPGQIVKYQFNFTVPGGTTPGTYREWFQPVLDGSPNWDVGGQVFLDITVLP